MLSWIDIVWRGCYYLVVGKGKGRDMNDNTVESTLFNDVVASNYGVIRNGVVVMEGNHTYSFFLHKVLLANIR